LSLGFGANANRSAAALDRRGVDRGMLAPFGAPHCVHQLVPIEVGGTTARDDFAVAHHDDAIGVVENFAEKVRNQDAACPVRDNATDESKELTGRLRIE